jgi:hypothetical protein
MHSPPLPPFYSRSVPSRRPPNEYLHKFSGEPEAQLGVYFSEDALGGKIVMSLKLMAPVVLAGFIAIGAVDSQSMFSPRPIAEQQVKLTRAALSAEHFDEHFLDMRVPREPIVASDYRRKSLHIKK